MSKGRRKKAGEINLSGAKAYRHADADSPLRPDVGTQAQFRKKNPQKLTAMILRFRQHWIGTGKILPVNWVNGLLP